MQTGQSQCVVFSSLLKHIQLAFACSGHSWRHAYSCFCLQGARHHRCWVTQQHVPAATQLVHQGAAYCTAVFDLMTAQFPVELMFSAGGRCTGLHLTTLRHTSYTAGLLHP